MMNAETTKLLLIENISLKKVSYWAATFPKQGNFDLQKRLLKNENKTNSS